MQTRRPGIGQTKKAKKTKNLTVKTASTRCISVIRLPFQRRIETKRVKEVKTSPPPSLSLHLQITAKPPLSLKTSLLSLKSPLQHRIYAPVSYLRLSEGAKSRAGMEREVYFYRSFFFIFIFFALLFEVGTVRTYPERQRESWQPEKIIKKQLAREGGTILAIRSHLISSARKNVAAAVVPFLLTWKTAFLLFRPSGYGLIANLASLIREWGSTHDILLGSKYSKASPACTLQWYT